MKRFTLRDQLSGASIFIIVLLVIALATGISLLVWYRDWDILMTFGVLIACGVINAIGLPPEYTMIFLKLRFDEAQREGRTLPATIKRWRRGYKVLQSVETALLIMSAALIAYYHAQLSLQHKLWISAAFVAYFLLFVLLKRLVISTLARAVRQDGIRRSDDEAGYSLSG